MAKTLLETLQTSQASEVSPGVGPQQQQAQQVLTTKATGLAASTTGTGPAASSQAAKLGLQEGKRLQGEQALAGRLQDVEVLERAKSQEAQLTRAEKQQTFDLKSMKDEFQNKANTMIDDFVMKKREQSDEQQKNQMENIGQLLRLSNTKYLDELKIAGQTRRLKDSIEADEAYAKTALGNSLDFLKDDLAYKKFMNSDDREFQKDIAGMDINYAMDMARESAKTNSQIQQTEAIGGLFSAGVQGVKASSDYSDKKDLDASNLSDARYEEKYGEKKVSTS